MKSPITGQDMVLTQSRREITFRKEVVEIVFHHWVCPSSQESFTSDELDELNLAQVHSKYREKLGIPFVEDIKRIRAKYQLPVTTMAEILGLGANSYHNYENGEVPSLSNAKLIKFAENTQAFKEMTEGCTTLDPDKKLQILKRLERIQRDEQSRAYTQRWTDHLMGVSEKSIYTGYANPSFDKFSEMVRYFAQELRPFKTKLNKLLFYADFTAFKVRGHSISGMKYVAIERGPVPHRYESLFDYMVEHGLIKQETVMFSQGYLGKSYYLANGDQVGTGVLSEDELEALRAVALWFKDVSASEISEISHLEQAWLDNQTDSAVISYDYAYGLQFEAR
jgi:putative zinc finger/helix-turn-helix YgiT family protein